MVMPKDYILCIRRHRTLNLGFFLQITYKRPLRLTILQSSLRFLMDAFTFIVFNFYLYLKEILPFVKS